MRQFRRALNFCRCLPTLHCCRTCAALRRSCPVSGTLRLIFNCTHSWHCCAAVEPRPAALVLLPGLWIASLFWFNRDPGWDTCALYFFGSYGLGAAAWWASQRRHAPAWMCAAAVIVVCALMVDYRLRIAVALAVALVLGLSCRGGLFDRCLGVLPLGFLGKISYAVFLVHFPVCLLVNALFVRLGWVNPAGAVWGLAEPGRSAWRLQPGSIA